MIAHVLAAAPQWVDDGKTWLGFVGAFVVALGSVWRYAVKPYLEYRERERKRDIADAAALRKTEIDAALVPLQAEVKRTGDKIILQGDAIIGINSQLAALRVSQESLHNDVREHMKTEDQRVEELRAKEAKPADG